MVVVGLFAQDPDTGEIQDPVTGEAITGLNTVTIEGRYATIDGVKYRTEWDPSSAETTEEEGVVRVPRMAGNYIVYTKDYELQEISNGFDSAQKYLAATGKVGVKNQFYIDLKARLDSLSVTLPSPSSGE